MYLPKQQQKTESRRIISNQSLDEMSLLVRQPVVKGLMGDNTLENLSRDYSLYRLPNEEE